MQLSQTFQYCAIVYLFLFPCRKGCSQKSRGKNDEVVYSSPKNEFVYSPKVARDGSTPVTAVVLRQRQTNFRRRNARNGLLAKRERKKKRDECRGWNRARWLHPSRSISLGGRDSSRNLGVASPRCRVQLAYARTRDDGLLVRIGRLSRVHHRGTMRRGLHIVVYIYASRHKSSFKSHSAAIRARENTHIYVHIHTDIFAHGARAWFVTDNARSSLNLTSLRADRPLRMEDRPTTNLYCK